MIQLDKTRQQKIHKRRIDTVTYDGAADTIIVEGSLEDRRFCPSHMYSGEIRPPYTVHHMIIRMELHLPELTIVDIELEMPALPHEACSEVRGSIAPLKGLRIAAGFTARVRKLVDRKKGCTHVLTLVGAMAQAAFQGAWSARIREPLDEKTYRGMMKKLKNTCWTWREEGPLIEKLNADDGAS